MKDNSKEIKIFYASISIFYFAVSIIEIFIPLYFFNKGFSISLIIFFFVLVQFFRFIFMPFSAWVSSSFGAKKAICFSFILSIIFYLFLGKIEGLSTVFYISSMIYGAAQSFLYLPFLVHMSKISPNNCRGKIVGRVYIYVGIASAIGPIIGGLIISFYGFTYGFAAVILLIIPAIFLLMSTPEISKIRKINFNSISIKKIYPDLIANGSYNFKIFLGLIVWPIFIFLIIPEYSSVGFVQTISLLVSIAAFYLAGKFTDKFNRKKILLYGSAVHSLIGAFRVLVNSFMSALLFNAAHIFSGAFQSVPWNAKIQEHMDKESRTEYVLFFEAGGALIAMFGLLLFALAVQSFSLQEILFLGIIVSSLVGFFATVIRK